MPDNAHDLQFTVLYFSQYCRCAVHRHIISAHLETFVLKNALDGGILIGGGQLGLEDDAERAIPDDLALGVLYLPCLAGNAILHLFLDYF